MKKYIILSILFILISFSGLASSDTDITNNDLKNQIKQMSQIVSKNKQEHQQKYISRKFDELKQYKHPVCYDDFLHE